MCCDHFRYACTVQCVTLLTCPVHQKLIPQGDHLIKGCKYWVKRRETKEYGEYDNTGQRKLISKTTTHTVFLYESKKKFFVIRPNIISYIRNDKPADYFREILGKGPRRGHKEKDWFFDLIYYIID